MKPLLHTAPDTIPARPGAYALGVSLAAPLDLALPGRPKARLAAGAYVYLGSARGPGGLAARLARHFRPQKAVRWHVDRLTVAGTVDGAWVFEGGDECALVARLSRVLTAPLPGFGASDCRRGCPAHLLALTGGWTLAGLASLLASASTL